MSRLRRLVLSGRYFFVTCNLLRTRAVLNEDDFEILARVMRARREEHGFLLSAWVFLLDPAAAVCAGVIWDGNPLEPPVIPAKAGIHSDDSTFPKVCGVDSRFRGNDQVSPNDTNTRRGVRSSGRDI